MRFENLYVAKYSVNKNKSITHYGIKDQQPGVRRYQNEDGTYTELGKKRRRELYKEQNGGKRIDKIKESVNRIKNNILTTVSSSLRSTNLVTTAAKAAARTVLDNDINKTHKVINSLKKFKRNFTEINANERIVDDIFDTVAKVSAQTALNENKDLRSIADKVLDVEVNNRVVRDFGDSVVKAIGRNLIKKNKEGTKVTLRSVLEEMGNINANERKVEDVFDALASGVAKHIKDPDIVKGTLEDVIDKAVDTASDKMVVTNNSGALLKGFSKFYKDTRDTNVKDMTKTLAKDISEVYGNDFKLASGLAGNLGQGAAKTVSNALNSNQKVTARALLNNTLDSIATKTVNNDIKSTALISGAKILKDVLSDTDNDALDIAITPNINYKPISEDDAKTTLRPLTEAAKSIQTLDRRESKKIGQKIHDTKTMLKKANDKRKESKQVKEQEKWLKDQKDWLRNYYLHRYNISGDRKKYFLNLVNQISTPEEIMYIMSNIVK